MKCLEPIAALRCTVLEKGLLFVFQITHFSRNQCLLLQEKTSRLCFQHALKHKCSPFTHALRMIQTYSKLSARSELSLEHSSKPVLNKALKFIADDF